MNEIEKMRSGLLADFSAPEVQDSFRHCKKLLAKFRTMSTYDDDYRTVLEDLIPGIPETSVIMPPWAWNTAGRTCICECRMYFSGRGLYYDR